MLLSHDEQGRRQWLGGGLRGLILHHDAKTSLIYLVVRGGILSLEEAAAVEARQPSP